jgi:hypothetical protein
VACTPSTPSYADLARMRKRGQRPVGPIYVTDDRPEREWLWRQHGLYGIPLPKPDQAYLLAGLWVTMQAKREERTQVIAEQIAYANPKKFSIDWAGERTDYVIGGRPQEWVAA